MATSPRWFRFSLRTLFMLVTVVCVTCGWIISQSRLVSDRLATRREIELHVGGLVYGLETGEADAYGHFPKYRFRGVSTLRRLMGDVTIVRIDLPWLMASELKDRTKVLFPEADIHCEEAPVWKLVEVRWSPEVGEMIPVEDLPAPTPQPSGQSLWEFRTTEAKKR